VKARGKIPAASPSPRFGADDSIDDIASELESSSRNDQGWLTEACLLRDNNRCVLTELYDVDKAAKSLSGTERKHITTIITKAAHIIPLSIDNFADTEVNFSFINYAVLPLIYSQLRNAATILDALYRYFPRIRSRINFSANKINDTCNAITLADTLHGTFREFQLAFEPTVRIVSKVLGCSFLMFLE